MHFYILYQIYLFLQNIQFVYLILVIFLIIFWLSFADESLRTVNSELRDLPSISLSSLPLILKVWNVQNSHSFFYTFVLLVIVPVHAQKIEVMLWYAVSLTSYAATFFSYLWRIVVYPSLLNTNLHRNPTIWMVVHLKSSPTEWRFQSSLVPKVSHRLGF